MTGCKSASSGIASRTSVTAIRQHATKRPPDVRRATTKRPEPGSISLPRGPLQQDQGPMRRLLYAGTKAVSMTNIITLPLRSDRHQVELKSSITSACRAYSNPLWGSKSRSTTTSSSGTAAEWEVVSRPVTFKKGHEVRARVQRPGNPATAREKYWAAHDQIQVRRSTVLSRAAAIIHEADDEATRNRELRRLRSQIQQLEEEKEDLMRRLAFVEGELEKARAKIPRGMSTS